MEMVNSSQKRRSWISNQSSQTRCSDAGKYMLAIRKQKWCRKYSSPNRFYFRSCLLVSRSYLDLSASGDDASQMGFEDTGLATIAVYKKRALYSWKHKLIQP
ncbi:hypothetical protein CEXT_124321 [Caerostris extrusa]|uniref:Uncharacterized protein n=1 Tax=Caerostris extrusa TaxID=172846 RepID=A0AAV4MA72_CAEEX|nr:hypothetical protein CEXT_124321 [Caerostris extrusa]